MREVGTKVLGSMSRKPDTSGTVGFAPTFDDTPSIAYIRLIPIQPNSHHLGPCKRSLPSLRSSSLPLSLFLSLSLSLPLSLSLSLSTCLRASQKGSSCLTLAWRSFCSGLGLGSRLMIRRVQGLKSWRSRSRPVAKGFCFCNLGAKSLPWTSEEHCGPKCLTFALFVARECNSWRSGPKGVLSRCSFQVLSSMQLASGHGRGIQCGLASSQNQATTTCRI